MISVIISGAFITWILYLYMKGKENLMPLLLYTLFSPYISLGSSKFDSLYFACIFFFVAILIKSRGRVRWKSKKWANRFYLLNIALLVLYLVSWLLFSRLDFPTTLTSLLGIVKLTLIVFFAYYMNRGITRERMTYSVVSALKLLTLLNTLACLIQLASVDLGKMIVRTYGSEQTLSFMKAVTQWGFFSRCFGIMETPMALGIVMLFAASFFFISPRKRSLSDYFYLCLTVICGACSASKTFWIGFVILMVMSIFTERRTVKGYIIRGLIVAAFLLVVLFYDQIGVLIARYLGSTYAYYWKFLSNPLEAFSTRYSEESVFLGFMPEFLKTYWLMGVGPSSIAGERAIDSAFVTLLHDGGFFALAMVVSFYLKLFISSRHNKTAIVLIALLFCTGFGFQTWIAARNTLFVMIYLLMSLDLKKKPLPATAAAAKDEELPLEEPLLTT